MSTYNLEIMNHFFHNECYKEFQYISCKHIQTCRYLVNHFRYKRQGINSLCKEVIEVVKKTIDKNEPRPLYVLLKDKKVALQRVLKLRMFVF